MKIKASWTGMALMICLLWTLGFAGPVGSEAVPSNPSRGEPIQSPPEKTGYLEQVAFDKVATKERVTIFLTRQSGVRVETASSRSVRVILEGVFIPEDLKKATGEGVLSNVIRVLPAQRAAVKGVPAAVLTIELQRLVPYRVSQAGQQVMIDFDVASLQQLDKETETTKAGGDASGKVWPVKMTAPDMKGGTTPSGVQKKMDREKTGKDLRERRITLDFQDASVKAVLRLMSEQGGVNIVSGDDVKGTMTVYVKDIPWDQALDTILNLTGLIKEEAGDIILVRTPKTKNLIDTDRSAMEASRRKLEDDLIAENSRKGRLQQVMIEAKIVEVSEQFSRSLGVQWGYGSSTTVGSGNYPFGIVAGTNPPSQTGGLTNLTTGVALTQSALAVNFPTAIAPAIGIVTGSAYSLFSAKLSALEANGQGKIISTPRVMTMEGKKAIIRQGSEIPVVTPASANSPATTTYKAAELKLEVEPKVTQDKRISMVIMANNDRPDTANRDAATGNYPVLTNKIDSSVVVNDGDTVVIGGILRTEETKQESGVPWFYRIPLVGWLFKQQEIGTSKRELLIFITPRILKDVGPMGQAVSRYN